MLRHYASASGTGGKKQGQSCSPARLVDRRADVLPRDRETYCYITTTILPTEELKVSRGFPTDVLPEQGLPAP